MGKQRRAKSNDGGTTTRSLFDAGGGVVDADRFPVHLAERLGIEPAVGNRDDLAAALQLLAWIESRQATVEARLEAEIALKRERAAEELQLTVAGQVIACDRYAAAIAEAAIDWCDAHAAELFAEGKTVTLPGGQVQQKKSPVRITAENDEEVVDQVLRSASAVRLLAELRRKVAPWLTVSLRINRTAIKCDYTAGRLPDAELSRRGLAAEDGEQITLKPRLEQQEHTAAAV